MLNGLQTSCLAYKDKLEKVEAESQCTDYSDIIKRKLPLNAAIHLQLRVENADKDKENKELHKQVEALRKELEKV